MIGLPWRRKADAMPKAYATLLAALLVGIALAQQPIRVDVRLVVGHQEEARDGAQ